MGCSFIEMNIRIGDHPGDRIGLFVLSDKKIRITSLIFLYISEIVRYNVRKYTDIKYK